MRRAGIWRPSDPFGITCPPPSTRAGRQAGSFSKQGKVLDMFKRTVFSQGSLLCVLALVASPHANAVFIVDNQPYTVLSGGLIDSYSLINGGTLIMESGSAALSVTGSASKLIMKVNSSSGAIDLSYGQASQINGATITAGGSVTAALNLLHSDVDINNSTITQFVGPGSALQATRSSLDTTGSTATVSNSTLTGTSSGAVVTARSFLIFSNTVVTGTDAGSDGIFMLGGTANLSANTRVIGDAHGIFMGDDGQWTDATEVTLDGSSVQATTGPSLLVTEGILANINVRNGSSLLSGNDNLLQVEFNSTANFNVYGSTLTGNVVADPGSTANVQLLDSAYLKGKLINVEKVTVGTNSTWEQVGNNTVGALTMAGGTVIVGPPGTFQTLTANTLTGSGNFKLNTDFENGLTDRVVINGAAEGNHQLLVSATGTDPKVAAVTVVNTGGGGAVFTVPTGAVDLGTYQYEPERIGDHWDLVRKAKTVSTSTKAALAAADALPSVMRGQDAILRRRMGDINLANEQRANALSAPIGAQNFVPTAKRSDAEPGVWTRTFGSDYDIDGAQGLDYGLRQYGVSVGADSFLPDSNVLLGITGGYDRSSLDLKRGSSGTIQSTHVGAYGLWANLTGRNDYLEVVAKLHYLDSDSKVSMTDGTQTSGGYNTFGLSTSAEYGRYIKLSREWFVEPFVSTDLQSVKGKNYHLKNGLKVNVDNSNSWRTKAGATLGRNWSLNNGLILQGYVRAAATYEFSGSNRLFINDNQFRSSQQGPGAEIGTGVNVSLSDKLNFFADVQRSQGEHITMPWAYSTGLRWAF